MFVEIFESIRDFTETGGIILLIIGALIFVMWILILERIFYVTYGHKQFKKQTISTWQARSDRNSWNAHQIRQAMISRVSLKLRFSLPIIQALVALCPLLGLMGTVTGMIVVFDVMAMSGGGNARSMAAGVSQATIPTMAGMVGALSGVFASTWLTRTAKTERLHLEDALEIQR
ncbi:MAG: MotA/TolQ/ExbB proton channel family protein [Aliiglaciecola sp.]|uniref:MotA/TolQ/ExbB proton channel family protein n=1 Tax=Alteromonadaceae TaxID=72275 RepID=UPI001C09E34E|nr:MULTISPECIES: MotA/TolQ/ExbB proton channel family protein [Aliiglaciecola]MBU2876088.1 MotA/TolQ/ExbB proton channel family protein [Aliiglaciecola lipolytica]MDO6695075.1 MotA/TolQ/ExbB proton channel family protein [Aliiglaciecola sp. 3_MG-2023]MDO6713289.1 MotA/TolQ/ExbB proton channel family protein [Aliiglaciecola sp. 2_MG-2023]MDO6754436.1 MotA/TolQ/ExbB proton channel family protein [Aliiglaciecola sp. 1_MG-2023]